MAPTRQDPRDSPDSDSVRTVQEAIVEVARKLNRPGWSAYLVGGTLRDLLVGPNSRHRGVEPRDVDIIVGGASREQLRDVLQEALVLERLTGFGGLHLSKRIPSGSLVLFDRSSGTLLLHRRRRTDR